MQVKRTNNTSELDLKQLLKRDLKCRDCDVDMVYNYSIFFSSLNLQTPAFPTFS